MCKIIKRGILSGLLCLILFLTWGCTKKEESSVWEDQNISSQLVYESSMELSYASEFRVDYYQGGYALLSVSDGNRYLVLPEGEEAPEDLDADVQILRKPFTNIYMVATAVMDMFYELDALDHIRLSSQKKEGWCNEDVGQKMEEGQILYAGKYNMPDYELILSESCSLAIENNMITHSPEVIEKMKSFHIPVFIDLSSYEKHPLGRVEWVKVYGLLLGKEEEAKAIFDRQCEIVDQIGAEESSGKTVAFFYITSNQMVSVRNSNDYVPKMIEIAGGRYIFENLGDEDSRRSSMTMQTEEFYGKAKDADYIVYNSTIDGELERVSELLDKEPMLKDFKAVQNGNVWCTTQNLYQESMSIGGMIEDFHSMLSDDPDMQKDMTYIYRLKQEE